MVCLKSDNEQCSSPNEYQTLVICDPSIVQNYVIEQLFMLSLFLPHKLVDQVFSSSCSLHKLHKIYCSGHNLQKEHDKGRQYEVCNQHQK